VVVHLAFLKAVLRYSYGPRGSRFELWPAAGVVALLAFYFETRPLVGTPHVGWFSSGTVAVAALASGWSLWNVGKRTSGHGARLLGGLFFLDGLHSLDRSMWFLSPFFPAAHCL
jgi:hypothetical protein